MRENTMRLTATASLILTLAVPARAQDPFSTTHRVTAAWLRQHATSQDLVVLEVDRNPAPYDTAHVPGARFLPMSAFTQTRAGILAELPPANDLSQLLGRLGISRQSRIVLYGDLLSTGRLFFTLDYLGMGDRTAVLDGGLPAWRAAGGAVTRDVPTVASRQFVPTVHPEVVVDADWIRARLDDPNVLLLDTRTSEEYGGERAEEGVSRPGHIPGAVNLNWTASVEDGGLLTTEALRKLLTDAGAAPERELVTYCRSGTRAAWLYFAARSLGYRVRLYDGSMNDWSHRDELPLVTGPQRRE